MSTTPNIVFIITDQQRYDTIHALGHEHMITPTLDKMVNGGTAFNNMYVTSTSCAPSRASLFSGVYPHTSGILRNEEPWHYTWVGLLADAGYHCVNIGKMHSQPFEKSFGFHERHVVENKDRDHPILPSFFDNWDKAFWAKGLKKPSRLTYRHRDDYNDRMGAFPWEPPIEMHSDVFVPQMAVSWLDNFKGDMPFFLQVGIPGPHPPYDPPQEYVDMYADRELPKAIRDYDLDSQPAALRALRQHHQENDHDAIIHLADPTDEQIRRQRAHYYANITLIDEQVGEILAALERRGVMDNTVVIFTSDHGDCLNDHGHSQKWTMHEPSVKVPAVMYWPGHIAADNQVDDLIALFDFGPTILELASVEPPEWMEARSLKPYFTSNTDPSRIRVFSEHPDDFIFQDVKLITMIREGKWKLVHFLDESDGQLFDLEADPDERQNLWDNPDHTRTRQNLLNEILSWRMNSDLKTQGFRQVLAETCV